mgnify:CR=1 FL=1
MPTQADIRGLIFDMDGVIADTAEFHYQSWKQLADEEGIAFDRADNEQLRGKTRDVSLQIFTEGLEIDPETRTAWMARKNRYFHERMRQLQPGDALPGITRLIATAQARGFKLGVGSSSRNARPVLERLALLDEFDVIGDGYLTHNSKPAPDIFLWVAGGLRLAPRHLLVIEDSEAGVQAALTGGFYVVGVGSAPVQDAHATYATLADVTLDDLLTAVQNP